jgi:hypothetical protein
MSSYIFRQRCRAMSNFRIPQILSFLKLVQEAFGCPALYDSRSRPVDLTESALRAIFEKNVDKIFPTIGANEDFFTIPPKKRDKNTVRIEIHTGTHRNEKFIDAYNISMDDEKKVPSISFFMKSIPIFRPFEAFLAEGENEYRLDAFDRMQILGCSRPAIIRGFHYLDRDMAQSIGGIEYCLKAPAWRVERFCDGVLIQLVPDLFDSDNAEHLDTQERVMAYFNMT